MKKLLAILLAAVLVLSLAACSGSGESTADEGTKEAEAQEAEAEAEEGGETEPAGGNYQTAIDLYQNGVKEYKYKAGEFKKYDEPITLTVNNTHDLDSDTFEAMRAAGEPVENGRWIQYFRDDMNIEWVFGWCESNSADYNQKLTLSMSEGALADVFYVSDQNMIRQLAEAGAILPLTELWQDNVNETLGRIMEEEGTAIYGTGIVDGEFYALPVKMPSTNTYNHCWIRRDWLEKVGMDVPSTMDEVKEVAKAFKELADGNIGLCFSKDFMSEMEGVFWAFGGQQNSRRNQWNKQEDGTIAYAEIQDNMKGGFEWLRDMYAEGLIPQESISMGTYDALANYVATEKCGLFYGPHWYGFQLQNFGFKTQNYGMGSEGEADWIEIPLPKGTVDTVIIPGNNTNDGWYCINANCEHPEAVIQTLNAYVEKLFGENNDFANFFACDLNSGEWNASPIHVLSATVDLDPYWILSKATNKETQEVDESKLYEPGTSYWNYIKAGLSAYQYMFGPIDSCFCYVDETYPQNILWNEYLFIPTQTYTDRWGSLVEILDNYEIKIVTGELDLDEGFAEMVQKFNEAGGAVISEEYNEIYADFTK
ncbi:MAG: extracellular solute-binding protein [Lachnospiraceae bacterium]|nr:extracellular solute-binding protein [Lachnospiraceae bacterium]